MIFQRTGSSFTFPSASISKASLLCGGVDDHFDEFERVYDHRFADEQRTILLDRKIWKKRRSRMARKLIMFALKVGDAFQS
jgi:hypothetical protein